MENFFAKIKEHPYLTAGIALVGGIILYTAFFSGGSSSSAPSQAQLDAANFATQTQGATDLAVAQAAQQAQQYQVGQEAAVAQAQIAGQNSIAQIVAQTQQNAQQLQAGVQQSLIAGSLQENLAGIQAATQANTLSANVAEAQISANQNVAQSAQSYGFQFGMAALQGAEASPTATSFSSPFGDYNTGGNYVPPPPPPPAPVAAVQPNILYPSGGGGVFLEPGQGGLASAPFPSSASGTNISGAQQANINTTGGSWFGDTRAAAGALASYLQGGGNPDSAATVAAESGPYDPFIAAHLPGYDTTFATLYNSSQAFSANLGGGGH